MYVSLLCVYIFGKNQQKRKLTRTTRKTKQIRLFCLAGGYQQSVSKHEFLKLKEHGLGELKDVPYESICL